MGANTNASNKVPNAVKYRYFFINIFLLSLIFFIFDLLSIFPLSFKNRIKKPPKDQKSLEVLIWHLLDKSKHGFLQQNVIALRRLVGKNLLFYYALKNRGFGSERIVALVSKKKRTATIVI
jgi:hypothetical protein